MNFFKKPNITIPDKAILSSYERGRSDELARLVARLESAVFLLRGDPSERCQIAADAYEEVADVLKREKNTIDERSKLHERA